MPFKISFSESLVCLGLYSGSWNAPWWRINFERALRIGSCWSVSVTNSGSTVNPNNSQRLFSSSSRMMLKTLMTAHNPSACTLEGRSFCLIFPSKPYTGLKRFDWISADLVKLSLSTRLLPCLSTIVTTTLVTQILSGSILIPSTCTEKSVLVSTGFTAQGLSLQGIYSSSSASSDTGLRFPNLLFRWLMTTLSLTFDSVTEGLLERTDSFLSVLFFFLLKDDPDSLILFGGPPPLFGFGRYIGTIVGAGAWMMIGALLFPPPFPF